MLALGQNYYVSLCARFIRSLGCHKFTALQTGDKICLTFAYSAAVARLAAAGEVRELWLTHFSPALTEPESHIGSAKAIFENAVVGKDGMVKMIRFEG